jgi:predicted permease
MLDLRLAVRALRASPIVSIAVVLSLALGIGANTALFSLVDGLLLRSLPVDAPDRLVTISTDSAVKIGFNAGIGWNAPMFEALRERAQAFDGVAAWTVQPLDLAQSGERQPIQALIATGGLFSTLGVRAAAGRLFTGADDVRGGGPDGPVAVISHDFWQRRFGGAPVAGTTLSIERVPFRIVGVTPRGFSGLEVGKSFDVALPLATEALVRGGRGLIDEPRNLQLFVLLRLGPGQPIATAQAALRAMQPEMHGAMQLPGFAREPFTLMPAGAGVDMPGSARPKYERALVAVFVIVVMVLLVACANIANLLIARAVARRHDVGVRLALGASPWRLARQLLVESLVLSGLGAAAGLLLAVWASRALVAQLALDMDTSLDWRALLFTATIATVTALLFGSGAAIRSMRVAPMDALKQQGRTVTAGRGGLSAGLVVAQVALSLVLVTAAGLFVRSLARLSGIPIGFDKEHVLLARVDVSRARIDPSARIDLYDRLAAAMVAVPGVTDAGASLFTPLDVVGLPGEATVPGAPGGTESERIVVMNRVTPAWFATYGTPLRAGRDFDARDTAAGPPVVIINDAFARKFFPGRNAIGGTVSGSTVIGVVGDQVVQGGYHADGRQRSIRDAAPPTMYTPLAQSGVPARPTATLSIRTAGDSSGVARSIATALRATDPDIAFSLQPLADGLHAAMAQERTVAALSGFFGGLAVLIAGLGLYGVTAQAVSRRRAEIGIRLALGAAPGQVVRLILSRVATLAGIGIAIGAGLSVWASTFAASLLYGLTPRDPVAILGAACTLAAVALVAGGLPAFRAARIDPMSVLRD